MATDGSLLADAARWDTMATKHAVKNAMAADDAFWDSVKADPIRDLPVPRYAGFLTACYLATTAMCLGGVIFPDRLALPAVAMLASFAVTCWGASR